MDFIPSITIPPELKEQIEAQARRDYPLETCGFLIGEADHWGFHVHRIVEASNSQEENPARFYAIDRSAYAAAEAEAADAGLRVLGVYHTHPDAPPLPSATDGDFAFPEWIYWISRIDADKAGAARVWLRTWDPLDWEELVLIVADC
jgi:proteasome lid subunit RPN8/RPN11